MADPDKSELRYVHDLIDNALDHITVARNKARELLGNRHYATVTLHTKVESLEDLLSQLERDIDD